MLWRSGQQTNAARVFSAVGSRARAARHRCLFQNPAGRHRTALAADSRRAMAGMRFLARTLCFWPIAFAARSPKEWKTSLVVTSGLEMRDAHYALSTSWNDLRLRTTWWVTSCRGGSSCGGPTRAAYYRCTVFWLE